MLIRLDGADETLEIEPGQRVELLVAMKGKLKTYDVGNVHEGLGHRARVGRRPEAVLVFGDLLGNLQRVLSHRAEAGGDFFGSVVVHVDHSSGHQAEGPRRAVK